MQKSAAARLYTWQSEILIAPHVMRDHPYLAKHFRVAEGEGVTDEKKPTAQEGVLDHGKK